MQLTPEQLDFIRRIQLQEVPNQRFRPVSEDEWQFQNTFEGSTRVAPEGAVQIPNADGSLSYAMPDGFDESNWRTTAFDDPALSSLGLQSKYNEVVRMPDGSVRVRLQQPGAHKYDLMDAYFRQGPDGQFQLQGMPSPVRAVSSSQDFRDAFEEGAPIVGAAALGMNMIFDPTFMSGFGGGGLSGMDLAADGGVNALMGGGFSGGGIGTLGTLPAVPGAVAPLSTAGLGAVSAPSLGTLPSLAGTGFLGSLGNFARSPGFWGPIVEGGLGLVGQNQAIRAADRASDAQINLLREMNAQNRADNQPLLDLRNSVLPKINALMQNPASLSDQPDYQFGLNEGNRQIANRQAASGNYYSGGALREAQRFGQDYAGSKLDQSLNRLMGVAGLGQIGGNNQQSANTNFGNMAGNALMNQGANRASGYMGITNTIGGAANQWFNNWQRNALGGP